MSPMRRRLLIALLLAVAGLVAFPAAEGWAAPARNVELLNGRVVTVAHDARGRAAVVRTAGGRRVLTLRSFRIDPGPRVRVYLVPRANSRSDGRIRRSFRDLGRLKGNRGNQQYTIPRSVDLRRFNTVVFWCVPFTQSLARADLRRS